MSIRSPILTLPPVDVRDELFARLGTLGQGSSLILGPTHHVQLDPPMENFWAMVNTILQPNAATGSQQVPISQNIKLCILLVGIG